MRTPTTTDDTITGIRYQRDPNTRKLLALVTKDQGQGVDHGAILCQAAAAAIWSDGNPSVAAALTTSVHSIAP